MNVSITKRMKSFAAAHQLPTHHGKCAHLHGHNYQVEMTFVGPIQTDDPSRSDFGMVIDFSTVSEIYQEKIHDRLDHGLILGQEPLAWYNQLVDEVFQSSGYALLPDERYQEAQETVDDRLGHVAHLPISVTTAENMAVWMLQEMNEALDDARLKQPRTTEEAIEGLAWNNRVRCVSVTIWETETSSATAHQESSDG